MDTTMTLMNFNDWANHQDTITQIGIGLVIAIGTFAYAIIGCAFLVWLIDRAEQR